MQTAGRRYDIDWLRVIAIGLLLIYHIAIVFQPWGVFIGFPQSEETSEAIWIPMALLNVWRIPILFFVSGMGFCFALRRRNWKQILLERTRRILVPLIFGILFIVPIHIFIFQLFYQQELSYNPGMAHLWFLGNICIYVLQNLGFAFIDKSYNNKFFNGLRKLLEQPYMLFLFIIPFLIEAVLMNPDIFTLYVGTGHGFVLGMLAFFFGILFVAIGDVFWNAVDKVKFVSLGIAFSLYLFRYIYFNFEAPNYLVSIESMCWIFTVFGFGHKFLNKPGKVLNYLSQAAYPVYIIHMIFLYLGAYIFLPLEMPLWAEITAIVLFTFVGCFITYDLFIRRIPLMRPLFGVKSRSKKIKTGIQNIAAETD